MICVFDVLEGPARGKRFWLRENQRLAVGRISTADFAVPSDQHMSRHHFIVEATINAFRIRDVGSSNGTFVNNLKVATLELCSGDRIRAGLTTLEVSLISDNASPHARDGLSLTSLARDEGEPSFVPLRSVDIGSIKSDSIDTRRIGDGEMDHPAAVGATVVPNRVNWGGQFSASEYEYLFYQLPPNRGPVCDLAELLMPLDVTHTINLVVNISQLGRFPRQLLMDWCNESVGTKISNTLYAVTSDGTDDFWNFIRSALRQDGMIAFASRQIEDASWLESFVNMLSYPSLLDGLLRRNSDQERCKILENCDYVFFEKDKSGLLGLLCKELPHNSRSHAN
jgi:pSer/pThr/pTyr-binding forkhead associated (FHA) protein